MWEFHGLYQERPGHIGVSWSSSKSDLLDVEASTYQERDVNLICPQLVWFPISRQPCITVQQERHFFGTWEYSFTCNWKCHLASFCPQIAQWVQLSLPLHIQRAWLSLPSDIRVKATHSPWEVGRDDTEPGPGPGDRTPVCDTPHQHSYQHWACREMGQTKTIKISQALESRSDFKES